MTATIIQSAQSRLETRLQLLREKGERALICYVIAGDPSLEKTVELVCALDRAGVDAVELGIPFSDPLADGPIIQLGSIRALAGGCTVAKTLATLKAIREVSEIPIVLMTYYNPVLQYGVARFAKDAAEAGADGVIQTDLTPEESDEWVNAARNVGLNTVFLAAPTSTRERLEIAAKQCSGFFYAVSRTGVTGASQSVSNELPAMMERIRAVTDLPVCVGFGISTPEHVRAVCPHADGVVVGSALVDLIGKYGDSAELNDKVYEYAITLKQATLS